MAYRLGGELWQRLRNRGLNQSAIGVEDPDALRPLLRDDRDQLERMSGGDLWSRVGH